MRTPLRHLLPFLILLPVFGILLMMTALPVSADEFYEILDCDVRMTVGSDNVYDITETYTVRFKEPRHGIYRDIAVRQYGYVHGITGVSVDHPENGTSYDVSRSREGDYVSLRIGDKDKTVEGDVRYRIRYRYDASDDRNRTRDEVNFNIVGSEWDATIGKVTMRVDMPEPFDPSGATFVSGSFGSTVEANVSWRAEGNSLLAETNGPLVEREGVTLMLPLPEGYFTEVSSLTRLPYVLLLLFLTAAVLALAIFVRFKYSNIHRIIPVLSFQPPEGLNPAETAYVFDNEAVTDTETATLILHWAARGHVRITEDERSESDTSGKMTFQRLSDLPTEAPDYERTLFKHFFKCGDGETVTTDRLENRFHTYLSAATAKIPNRFRKEHEILVNSFQSRTAWSIAGLTLFEMLFLSFLANGAFGGGMFFVAMLFSGLAVLSLLGVTLGIGGLVGFRATTGRRIGAVVLAAGWFVFLFLPLVAGLGETVGWEFMGDYAPLVVLPLLYGVAVRSFSLTKVYTPYAIDLVSRIRGFREFIATAKSDRLEMLFQQTPAMFYDILPYAVVFGLTRIWEKHLDAIAVPPPSWYASPYGFSSPHFLHAMHSTMNYAASTPSSSSSGGGGGGSVGGGGGGGGGGSW